MEKRLPADPVYTWSAPPDRPALSEDAVHVWRVSLHNAAPQSQKLEGLLAPDEISRAQNFHFSRDRDHFVIVRGILRILLGSYLQIFPQQVQFHYNAYGKPGLALNRTIALDFNVSHSHEMALLAFREGKRVGVDVEHIRPEVVREQIAERFFSRQECAILRALPKPLQPEAFFNCWTRKEAFIKATGEGLSRPLDQFSVSLAPGEPARLLDIQGEPEGLSKWTIQELEPGPGYAAALVTQSPVKQIRCWEYP